MFDATIGASDRPIDWPAAFGSRFIVFIDVEEEFDWSRPLDRDNRSTTAVAALPAAHARFADAGVALTCMVDHPVACDPAAVDALRSVIADGRSEIGAQLHPWVTPPYAPPRPGDSYAGTLNPAEEGAKIDTLTAALTTAFGRPPRSYRAGRYGIGPNTLRLLADRGYRLDSSVRPHYDYRADGGPDFTRAENTAYRRDGIVELPLTTRSIGPARRYGPALHRHPLSRRLTAGLRLAERIALTPEAMPADAVAEAIRDAAGEGDRLLVFSFHSPSLVPGHTPYVRDQADLLAFWRWWDRILKTLGVNRFDNASLGEVLGAAS